ncbi:UNVERIFIED_CONTAM: hypothetical protein FKN15_046104 [Acipenser sinensis]
MASPEPQPRFGQSVKGLLSQKVSACSGDVIALTRQVLKGSRSQEESLRKMAVITTHLQYHDSVPACGSEAKLIHSDVKDYYGKRLQKSEDLQTNACTTSAKPKPAFIRKALKDVHPEVTSRYYGCGLVVPESLENCYILDLGCGSGQDCYMLSQLVGEKGHVTGIDMTEEQLAVARKHIDYHTEKFGFKKPNVDFVQGFMELLGEAGLKDSSYDIIISNCVVNLSPDKAAVLREAYRVLKDGGEMYFSDVYSNQALTKEIREHKVLWGECLGGALWWEDLVRLAQEVGFSPPRLVTASHIAIGNKELGSIVGEWKRESDAMHLHVIITHRNTTTTTDLLNISPENRKVILYLALTARHSTIKVCCNPAS